MEASSGNRPGNCKENAGRKSQKSDGDVCVKLLPALPSESAWQTGFVRGLAIKGGYTIDFEWKDGKVVDYSLKPEKNALSIDKVHIVG